jgi:peroxiredoxin family protein
VADLLILAHGGRWEQRFQISSLAASAASVGEQVEIALFFAALAAWAGGGWDRLDPEPPLTAERLAAFAMPPLSELLTDGRASGRIRLFACSASTRLLELDPATVQAAVDAIVGWQTFRRMIAETPRVVTL